MRINKLKNTRHTAASLFFVMLLGLLAGSVPAYGMNEDVNYLQPMQPMQPIQPMRPMYPRNRQFMYQHGIHQRMRVQRQWRRAQQRILRRNNRIRQHMIAPQVRHRYPHAWQHTYSQPSRHTRGFQRNGRTYGGNNYQQQ